MADLDALYWWFNAHREEIITGNEGSFVLLKDNAVIAYYATVRDALCDAGERGFKIGDFLIQKCRTEQEDTMTWYNPELRFG
jgi:hypothetical protein